MCICTNTNMWYLSAIFISKKHQGQRSCIQLLYFIFVLTDKLGRGWTKSKANSGNLSKLRKFRTPQTGFQKSGGCPSLPTLKYLADYSQ